MGEDYNLLLHTFADIKGYNILFNDGHVEFVKPEELDKLKWKAEQKQ